MSLLSVAISAQLCAKGALTNSLPTHRSVAARRHEKCLSHELEHLQC